MTSSGSFFAHWRVRFGYPLAVAVFWLARTALFPPLVSGSQWCARRQCLFLGPIQEEPRIPSGHWLRASSGASALDRLVALPLRHRLEGPRDTRRSTTPARTLHLSLRESLRSGPCAGYAHPPARAAP